MLQILAKKITASLVLNKIISPDDMEAYTYGLELLIPKLVLYLLVFILAALTKTVVVSLLFVVMYMSLRKYTGGFHCKTAERCLCVSLLIHILMITVYYLSISTTDFILLALSAVSSVVIVRFSPIENENRPLDNGEKHKYKVKSILFMVVILILMVASILLHISQLFYSSVCSLTADAVLIILSLRRKNYEKGNIKGDRKVD